MIRDGITVNGLHSFRDFGLCIKEKKIGLPTKHIIQDSVPYMNGSYDFTTLGGDATWGDREITFTFDILAESEQAMNRLRDSIINWLMNVHNADIFDDAMPGWHFHGSYSGGDMSDDMELSEFSVSFICHPFRIADTETAIRLNAGESVIDYAGQAVAAYVSGSVAGSITFNGAAQSFLANTRTELSALLGHGTNTVNLTVSGNVTLYYTEEII